MPVGDGRRFGAAWIDHHHAAPALADFLDAAGHAGRGHQAAAGHARVSAQNQQVVRAVDVRHWDQGLIAKHQAGGQYLGHVINRGRREQRARAQRHRAAERIQQAAGVVRGGIADVDRVGIGAILARDVLETLRCQTEGLVPADLLEVAAVATQRPGQHVTVFAQHFHALALGTDKAAAERIMFVTADVDHFSLRRIDCHDHATTCFADRAFAGVPTQTAFRLYEAHGSFTLGLLDEEPFELAGLAPVFIGVGEIVSTLGDLRPHRR